MRGVAVTVVILLLASALTSRAEVVRVEIHSREDVLGGRAFGDIGPYEKIVGRVYFAFDPANPMNARIVDLELAPRNMEGRVEAWASFVVLRPKNPTARGVALLEVSNRGGKASLAYFNGGARALDPRAAEDFGDGLLMRLGLTVIWVGWQQDVPLRDGLLRLHGPGPLTNDGEPIAGFVRADWVVDEPTHVLRVGHRDHVAYPVHYPDHPSHVLTVRDGRDKKRKLVPRAEWLFTTDVEASGVEHLAISHSTGFEAGMIYELVYGAVDPIVVGLGLAAIRDMMSHAKYDTTSVFPARYGIALGISQTGRFLRHFIYQGFNTDERGRQVFDGMMIHTAGAGRGSFNHRFAQPSRDAHRYSAFSYPTDVFPFTSRRQRDGETGTTDGLFAKQHDRSHLPRVFYTNTGYEYWGRAAALIHTSVDGLNDVRHYSNERIYHLASAQHFVERFPPSRERALPDAARAYWGNPIDFLPTMRALLVRMVAWVRDGEPPPASAYPMLADGTLVTIEDLDFPDVRGVRVPKVAHEAYRADYGPRWPDGIIDRQPPDLGKRFPVLVPQADELGNELGGLRVAGLRAPLATYAPWSLRVGLPGRGRELRDFRGTFIPLPRDEEERKANGDPRPSIEALYGSRDAYLARLRDAAAALVHEGTLLDEDVDDVVARGGERWDWIMGDG